MSEYCAYIVEDAKAFTGIMASFMDEHISLKLPASLLRFPIWDTPNPSNDSVYFSMITNAMQQRLNSWERYYRQDSCIRIYLPITHCNEVLQLGIREADSERNILLRMQLNGDIVLGAQLALLYCDNLLPACEPMCGSGHRGLK
ncbi:hypothetical protein M406DRAFT_71015 [Cryphonectria parasitica EP155]|uniref:Uncharacterized protein n=1 Tax=Cryphonectria parasitica (strain ATCC 38755 / EP155) TaxID=660469 RepID=A0A9P4Y0Q4_CRYP1|nr:uncharacterized protein M406DRAFT_71015 [Cryphonectria parasitica EP155]KAF3764446.1 hypothetical protein M406DRAFT_71015 [Cryphonectria parasitica EP155]